MFFHHWHCRGQSQSQENQWHNESHFWIWGKNNTLFNQKWRCFDQESSCGVNDALSGPQVYVIYYKQLALFCRCANFLSFVYAFPTIADVKKRFLLMQIHRSCRDQRWLCLPWMIYLIVYFDHSYVYLTKNVRSDKNKVCTS